jgi:hypothetical protein
LRSAHLGGQGTAWCIAADGDVDRRTAITPKLPRWRALRVFAAAGKPRMHLAKAFAARRQRG